MLHVTPTRICIHLAGLLMISTLGATATARDGLTTGYIDRSRTTGLYSTNYGQPIYSTGVRRFWRNQAVRPRVYAPSIQTPHGTGHGWHRHATPYDLGYRYNGARGLQRDVIPFSRMHINPRLSAPHAPSCGAVIIAPDDPSTTILPPTTTPSEQQQRLAPAPPRIAPHAPKLFMPPDPADEVPFDERPPAPADDEPGWNLLVDGDVTGAANVFIEEATLTPSRAMPRVGFALCVAIEGNDDAAIWAMRRAFSIDADTLLRFQPPANLDVTMRELLVRYGERSSDDASDVEATFMTAALHFLLGENDASGTDVDIVLAAEQKRTSSRALRRVVDERLVVAEMRAEEAAGAIQLATSTAADDR